MSDEREESDRRSERASRKRIEEIFGRGLADEQDDTVDERAREDWYRENRPPHHDPA